LLPERASTWFYLIEIGHHQRLGTQIEHLLICGPTLRIGIHSEFERKTLRISKLTSVRLVKMIEKVDKTLKWPLLTCSTGRRWVADSGRMIILGDAAHAMLPYMSEGAGMAVEDGVALAEALNHAQAPFDIARCLSVFESVRSKRLLQMQHASAVNGMIWHFADGPEQEARDAALEKEVLGQPFDESPNQWSDPVTQRWAYGYDAVEAIRDKFRDLAWV
jgi:salicylate hydroxylase